MSDNFDNNENYVPVDDERLVAYLDGELGAEEAARVQLQLDADPLLRSRLDSLSGVWTMLDELPRPTVDHATTESTLEIVAIAAQSDAEDGNDLSIEHRLSRIIAYGSAISAAFVLGFACILFARPDVNGPLLDDLPVIENLDELRQIGDIEFLRELHRRELFSEDSEND